MDVTRRMLQDEWSSDEPRAETDQKQTAYALQPGSGDRANRLSRGPSAEQDRRRGAKTERNHQCRAIDSRAAQTREHQHRIDHSARQQSPHESEEECACDGGVRQSVSQRLDLFPESRAYSLEQRESIPSEQKSRRNQQQQDATQHSKVVADANEVERRMQGMADSAAHRTENRVADDSARLLKEGVRNHVLTVEKSHAESARETAAHSEAVRAARQSHDERSGERNRFR